MKKKNSGCVTSDKDGKKCTYFHWLFQIHYTPLLNRHLFSRKVSSRNDIFSQADLSWDALNSCSYWKWYAVFRETLSSIVILGPESHAESYKRHANGRIKSDNNGTIIVFASLRPSHELRLVRRYWSLSCVWADEMENCTVKKKKCRPVYAEVYIFCHIDVHHE